MSSALDKHFLPVPDDKCILTGPFLEACDQIPLFLNCMGKVFIVVKNDINGNIEKIRKRYKECPEKFNTLNDILDVESQETDKMLKQGTQGIGTNALMWLRRGLHFIMLFFEHLIAQDYGKEPENLKNCAKMAYEATLKQYHGFVVRNIFSVATAACPSRSRLLKDLAGQDNNDQDACTLNKIETFIPNFKANILTLEALFKEKGEDLQMKA